MFSSICELAFPIFESVSAVLCVVCVFRVRLTYTRIPLSRFPSRAQTRRASGLQDPGQLEARCHEACVSARHNSRALEYCTDGVRTNRAFLQTLVDITIEYP